MKKGREGKKGLGTRGGGGMETKYFHESSFHEFMFLWERE
jgi:hypothetical protein